MGVEQLRLALLFLPEVPVQPEVDVREALAPVVLQGRGRRRLLRRRVRAPSGSGGVDGCSNSANAATIAWRRPLARVGGYYIRIRLGEGEEVEPT